MRVIPLTTDQSPEAALEMLYAYTVFPEDEQTAQVYYFYRTAPAWLRSLDPSSAASLPVWLLSSIATGPGREQLDTKARSRFRLGATAGAMLVMMRAMSLLGVKPSVARAVALIEAAYAMGRANLLGVPLRADAKDAKRAWQEMRSVIHIYAAMSEHMDLRNRPGFSAPLSASLSAAFGLSHSYLEFGASIIPSHVKDPKPLLDRTTSWTLPERFPAVRLVDDVTAIDPWVKAAILSYKAEARR